MNSQQFYRWMDDPTALDPESLAELQQVAAGFPYFSTGRILYLLNLKKLDDYRFEQELKNTAIFIADRSRLRDWINFLDQKGNENGVKAEILPLEPEQDNSLREIENQIRDNIREIEQKQMRLKELMEEKKTLLNMEPGVPEEDNGHDNLPRPLPKDDLLEDFLLQQQSLPSNKKAFYNPEDYARKSIEENDGILSETLARLVAAQGKKEKAIKIYQQLMLKYPQKSSYFAAQIEKLKKES
ncbi:MAG: hypothetical protein RBS55_07350 [Bacteroidales bacterium]|jgi:hypothetical protein|nr:hypothetical protein [Bacteroidales bacterium]